MQYKFHTVDFQVSTRVSNASGFYFRAIASPVNSKKLRAMAENCAELRGFREQLRATELRFGNPSLKLPRVTLYLI